MKSAGEKSTHHSSQSGSSNLLFKKSGEASFFAPAIQTKLKVSQPGEKHEQEADAMADKVMRMPEPKPEETVQRQEMSEKDQSIQRKEEKEKIQAKEEDKLQREEMPKGEEQVQRAAKEEEKIQAKSEEPEQIQRQEMPKQEEPTVQRMQDGEAPKTEENKIQAKSESEEKLQKQGMPDKEQVQRKENGTPTAPSHVHSAINQKTSGGQSMSPGVKTFMESRFNADFSKVKIHRDQDAASLNNQLSAKAFTYQNHIFFGRGQYEPGTSDGKHLLAHELTHVMQQGHAVHRAVQPATTAAQPQIQRFGISDALDYFADKAYLIPGFRMFTIVLGVNPINMQAVERSAANILRAVVEFLPGGFLITQVLDKYGVFDRAGAFIEQQIHTLGMTGSLIRNAINTFLDSLSWSDIFDLGGVWERAKRIFTDPINRILNFVRSLFSTILQFIRDAVLRPLAALAEGTRGYDLLKALLGQDPLTGDPYPRTAETIIGGFMKLIGQEEVWENIKRGNAVARAWAWFQGALAGLLGFVRQIPSLLINTLRSLELSDFLILPNAFAKVFRAFSGFVGQFISWAGSTVLNLLEILFSVVAPGVMPYLRRAAGAFQSILRNPIGFIGNLIRAVLQGFRSFASHIFTHLKNSLIQWLTGSLGGANIYIPQSFELKELIKFVLSVLGLTWENIRPKLVKVLGEPVVKGLETTFGFLVTLVREGPAAAWEQIKEYLSNLKEVVMGEIMNFVVVKIVQSAITKLLTSLNPAGAVIQAIIAIYNTIMFLVERMKQIIRVGMAVINSIVEIASGAIGRAAAKVEQTMAGLLTLVISFLARIVGLGKISDVITNIIQKIRAPIDRAIDKLIEWIVSKAKSLFAKGQGPDTRSPQEKQQALGNGLKEANALLANEDLSREDVEQRLPAIKTKYKLNVLQLVVDGETESDTLLHVHAELNPVDDTEKKKKPKRPPVKVGDKVQIMYNGDWSVDYLKITNQVNQYRYEAAGKIDKNDISKTLYSKDYSTEWRKYNPYKTGDAWEAIKNLNAWASYKDASQTLSYRKHGRFNVPPGKNWHHIHEQSNNGPNTLGNLALVDAGLNQGFLNHYFNKVYPETNGLPLRKFLAGKDHSVHMEWGLKAIAAAGKAVSWNKNEGRGPYNEID